MTDHLDFEESGGNIFEDLGFDSATAALLTRKAELVGVLHRAQQERGISQTEFGKLVGIPQARLSNLYAGKMGGMSLDKLFSAVAKIGANVTIRVDEHPKEHVDVGRLELEFA
jgi:predicted XRE-type DNA-binding protein